MSNKKLIKQDAANDNLIGFDDIKVQTYDTMAATEEAPILGTDGNTKLIVKKTLSFGDAIEFVADIVDACIGDDGDYTPEGFDMAVRVEVFTKYGNFKMPSTITPVYQMLYETSIYEQILDMINIEQFKALKIAAQQKIEYRADMSASMATKKLNELLAKMDEIANASASVFAGIDSSQINKIMGNIADIGNINEGAIAKAFAHELATPKGKERLNKKALTHVSDDTIVLKK